MVAYFEVYLRATTGTARARLHNDTDDVSVAGSEVVTTSPTYVRLRSGALTLLDGRVYSAQLGAEGSDTGAFKAAKLVMV